MECQNQRKILITHSVRWITRLADRWRAQQSAITIANCRIYWAAISWTQMAVSGIPETTFAWGSIIKPYMNNACRDITATFICSWKLGLQNAEVYLSICCSKSTCCNKDDSRDSVWALICACLKSVDRLYQHEIFSIHTCLWLGFFDVHNTICSHDLRRARLPAEFKHITKRRKRK